MTYSVQELLSSDVGRWDKRIATDLAAELEGLLSEKSTTLPEIRRLLAVKGYREMRMRIQTDTLGCNGDAAIRAMAVSMRAFAHERPGLSAATFRTPLTDTPVWRREGELLQEAALAVFARAGLEDEKGVTALRILRTIVRGFVLHEMAASFLDDVDYDAMFEVTLSVFIRGLDEIKAPTTPRPNQSQSQNNRTDIHEKGER